MTFRTNRDWPNRFFGSPLPGSFLGKPPYLPRGKGGTSSLIREGWPPFPGEREAYLPWLGKYGPVSLEIGREGWSTLPKNFQGSGDIPPWVEERVPASLDISRETGTRPPKSTFLEGFAFM